MIKLYKKGFTLIELLVVVAIIGILATVVLAALGSVRTTSRDAAVTSQLSSMRTEVEIVYNGSYSNLCIDKGGVYNKYETGVISSGGSISRCDATAWDYRIVAALPSSLAFETTTPKTAYAASKDGFCINSLGTAQKINLADVIGDGGKIEGIASPACNSGEIPANYSQYCVNICSNECNERDVVTGDLVANLGAMPNALCTSSPDCPWNVCK